MTCLPLLLAPLVVAGAAAVERRLGPSAAGWTAALPFSFAVAVVAVTVDAGPGTAAAMALSAAAHVPAQVLFGVVFAGVLLRRGLAAGLAAGTATYVGGSALLAGVPVALAVGAAVPALLIAPRAISSASPGRPARPGAPRPWSGVALTCAAASVIVGAALLTSRAAGPAAAGAVAAFPTICTLVAALAAHHDGRRAGAHALAGLVRSLPCYLAFCLAAALALPAAGLAALAPAVLACVAAAGVTWRGVPTAPRAAVAG
ncbi:MAG: hypothetical protein ABW060_05970 [Solirubrobacteraceae bacterium]